MSPWALIGIVLGSVLLGVILSLAVPSLRRVLWHIRLERVGPFESIELEDLDSEVFEWADIESEPLSSEPPGELLEVLRNGECVLFAGSGMGAMAGSPSYRELLESLIAQTSDFYSQDMLESLREQLEHGDTELVAELLAPRMPAETIVDTLHSLGSDEVALEQERLLHLISRLPFSGALTDIWSSLPDLLFERRDPVVISPGRGADLRQLLRSEAFFVAHLQGLAKEPETLRMSWQQYRMVLLEDREFERFMASLDSSRTILFLGAETRTIEQVFQSSDLHHRGGREHFALVPWHPRLELRAQSFRDRFGVRLLPYDPDVEGQELTRFVQKLHEGIESSRPVLRRRELSLPPMAGAVRLENIGPFESLELPLHPRATVLLGDNSSGKSSVLRAIALALSGEGPEVDRVARGLLRAGTSKGQIELLLDGDPYRAMLRRDGRGVSVRADQRSPVADGLWLGLGFPPLRGAPSAPLEGPSGEPDADPSALDLFPLAGDQVDDRLGDLQQWVINTALRAESGSRAGRASRQMLDAFFSIVAELTPGIDFEFGGIDRESWQVMVKTRDGLLSLDQLSRGMTAMFSWVGVLLQRLSQLYGDDRDSPSSNRGALLLVDEVDLHLHPEWQRQILPLIGRHFPKVQLIASTHSPLVVGSLVDAQLVHLQRTEDALSVELLDAKFGGWRSDQILTGPAFDLPTTRDQATEREMHQYTEMLSRGDEGEKEKVRELGERLRIQVPGPQESESGRDAANLVRDAIQQRIDELPPERRDRLAHEAELYLQELRTGTEAPDDPH